MTRSSIALAGLTTLLFSGVAFAHAQVDHAIPPVGSTVAASPPEIRVFFTQPLNPAQSGIELTSDSGVRVTTGKAVVDGQQMALQVPALAPGKYLVKWHVVGVDGHPMTGDYPFEIEH
jgi:copper resistance protein C